VEGERKIKRAKERESPLGFFPALSLALFFARTPLSERLEQARVPCTSLSQRMTVCIFTELNIMSFTTHFNV